MPKGLGLDLAVGGPEGSTKVAMLDAVEKMLASLPEERRLRRAEAAACRTGADVFMAAKGEQAPAREDAVCRDGVGSRPTRP